MGNAVSGPVDDDNYRCNLCRILYSVCKGDDADDGDERVAMDCGASTFVGVAKDVPGLPQSVAMDCGASTSVGVTKDVPGVPQSLAMDCGASPSVGVAKDVPGVPQSVAMDCGASTSVGVAKDVPGVPQSVAMDCGASPSAGVAKDVPGVPQSLDVTGKDNERDHVLEAKHRIFLSHSGVQKSFVADLCVDLMRRDRHPFFDKLRSSLPVGEKFPCRIFDAIRQCEVGVVVLSEEFFTKSKWPMLELAAMVEESRKPNAKIRIIPVFYGISRERCVNPDVQDEWMRNHWREWKEKDKQRIDVKKWQSALGIFGGTTAIMKKDKMLDGELRAEIVEAVCKMVRRETRWDDSCVEGKTRLLEKICRRIYKGVDPIALKGEVRVVGLYGMGGVGKTTLCKILCNELCGEYHDKVCHVEFGSAREEELLQKVLRNLSDLEVERLGKLNVDECHTYLKTSLREHRVFVAVDNVTDDTAEQAKSLLRANFGDGSVVLVTARSRDQLQRLDKRFGVAKRNCFLMPDLEVEEAKSLFLNNADLKENDVDGKFLKTCLERCYFSMSSNYEHYHPLALKVLGNEVGDMIRGGKDESAVLRRIGNFNLSRQKENRVFSILRSSFDSMPEDEKLLFLDIALDLWLDFSNDDVQTSASLEWVFVMHKKDRDEVEDMLEHLKRKSLLESFGADEYGLWKFNIHDLWREFAKEEMKVWKFGDRRWVCMGEKHIERVDLTEYPKLEAVRMHSDGKDVEAVDVRGLKHLMSIDFEILNAITKQVIGLGTLERLTFLSLWNAASVECIAEIGMLTNLQYVDLRDFRGDKLPDMSKLTNLQSLHLLCARSLECINVQNLPKLTYLGIVCCDALRRVDFSGCRSLMDFDIAELDQLEELNMSFCPLIPAFETIQFLRNLRKLNIIGCTSIERLDRLGRFKRLEVLRARECERLVMLPECKLPNLRVLDIESWKVPVGVVTEKCFPMLELELEEAKALFLNRADLTENDMGEEFVNTCLSSCYFPMGQSFSLEGKHYHPVALKVLGCEVGNMLRSGEDECAVLSRISDFNLSQEIEHPIFSILKWSFDWMRDEHQLLFLDITLDMGLGCLHEKYHTPTSMEWLCMMHGKDRDELEDMLEYLMGRSLLESFGVHENGELILNMHDMWREFAKKEVKVGRFCDRRWVYEDEERSNSEGEESSDSEGEGCSDLEVEERNDSEGEGRSDSEDEWVSNSEGEGCSDFEGEERNVMVDLTLKPKLEALKITSSEKDVVRIDVQGLKHLKSIKIEIFDGVVEEVIGLGSLERLTYLLLWNAASAECIAELELLTNLQHVDLSEFQGDRLPDMSKLTSLQNLKVHGAESLQCINVQNLPKLMYLGIDACDALRSVDISGCKSMRSLMDFNIEGGSLKELNISSCPLIPSLEGLELLTNLRKLNITGCTLIENFVQLSYLEGLEELRARDCERLGMLPECKLPNLRVLDVESRKVPIGFGIP